MNKKPDLLDMEKYERKGAYHHRYFNENIKNYREHVLIVLQYIMDHEPCKSAGILDIGCGDALYVKLLLGQGYTEVCGLDANPLAVELAKKQGITHVYEHNICDEFEFLDDVTVTDEKYDAIVWMHSFSVGLLMDVFEHIPTPEIAIKQITKLISKRLYLLNPLWNSDKYHSCEYDAEKIELLFSAGNWKLKDVVKMGPLGRKRDRHKELMYFEK